jgi:uncharacterized protein YozE (UPF0346 family)
MGQHKLKSFLKKQRWHDDLARQFADDAEADTTLPDAKSWEQLEAYLTEHEAVPEALSAARYVWEQYDKARHGRNV